MPPAAAGGSDARSDGTCIQYGASEARDAEEGARYVSKNRTAMIVLWMATRGEGARGERADVTDAALPRRKVSRFMPRAVALLQ